MRLTKQSNYAVRALMYCAINEFKLSRVAEIANAYHISEAFLFKLIKPLVDHGLLESVRGRHGGLRLGRPAEEITLSQVLRVTEDNFAMAECFIDGQSDCPLVGICEYSTALNGALEAFFEALDNRTIADMVLNKKRYAERLTISA